MNALGALQHGLRETAGRGRLATLLYGAHILLALPAAYALQAMLGREFGQSLAPERLLSGFDFTVWADFLNDHGDALLPVMEMAVGTGVLSLLVGPFLAGGTLAMIGSRAEPFSAASFFHHCGAFYFRFLRLMLIFGSVACVMLAASTAVLSAALGAVDEDSLSEVPAIVTGAGGIIVMLIALTTIFLAADYARISVFRRNSAGMTRATLIGFGFVLRNFLSVASLQILVLVLLALLAALYLGVDSLFPAQSGGTILLLVLVQQIFMFGRVLLRITGLSAQVALFEDRREQPLILYGWDDSPTPGYKPNAGPPAGIQAPS